MVRKTSLGIVETNQQSFFSKNRLQNSFFFLKINKEFGKAWRKRPLSPVSLSVFSLVPDLLFDCSLVLEYAKIRTCCSLFEKWKPNQLIWMAKQNCCRSKWISFINFWLQQFSAKRTKKATVLRDGKSNQGPLKRRNVLRDWSMVVQRQTRDHHLVECLIH